MAAENVFIGVASMPSRVDTLRQVVESLLPQCAQLGVYLNDYQTVPEFLNDPRILVARSQDHGNLRDNGKFFFLGQTEHKFYASVDDDIAYPADYIARLLRNLKISGGTGAVAVHGFLLPETVTSITSNRYVFHFGQSTPFLTPANLVGTGTAIFNQHKWKLKFSEFGDPGMSDVWFALAASKRKAPLWVIPRANKWMSPLESEAPVADAKSAKSANSAKSLFDEFKGRDSRQTELLKSVGIHGSWNFYLRQIFSVDAVYKNYCLTQAMQASVFATQLGWQAATEPEVAPYLKLLKDKNAAILQQASGLLASRLSKRWVEQYSHVTVDFIRGRVDATNTLSFVKQLPVLLAELDDSALPNNFKWDARPDRQQQMKSFILRTYRQNAESSATNEVLTASSALYVEYGLEDLIAMATGGSRSDFFAHPEFTKLSKTKQASALELAYRYLNALPDLKASDLPSRSQWQELFSASELSQKSLVAYAYLLSKTGSDEATENLLRELTRRFGVNLELLLLGSRLGLKTGSDIEPVASTLSKFELALGYSKAAKGSRRAPKVSVIVTSFDQVDGIKSTVDNVLASTYENLEVIVVDDASSDGSSELLETLVDARVRKVALSQNVGPYMARNAALKVAKGDFVAFHDCGDYSSINRIQAQVDLLLAEPDLKAVRTRHLRLTDDGLPIFENNVQFLGDAPVTMMVRREVFKKVGPFLPTRTRGDIEFLRRLQAMFGADSVGLIDFPFYTASTPKNSVRFNTVSVRNFLRRCNAWHAAISENPAVFENWLKDGLLPFEIPAEISPSSPNAAKD